MVRWLRSPILWGIVIVAGIAAFFVTSTRSGEAATNAGQYVLVPVEQGDIVRSVSTSGTVQPLVNVEVGSQLSGQLIEVLADFNTEVEEGQLLARIDPDTFQSRLEETQAQLSIASAGKAVAQASLKRAQANLNQRQNDLARFEPLLEYDAISEIEVDAARAQYEAAVADYDSALAQVENAAAVFSQREAALRQAKVDLQRTNIRAPIDGVVILRNVDVGQTVAASLQAPVLFEIAQDLSKIQIEADVNEADIGAIKTGNRVTFSVDAYPDREFSGEVRQVRLAPKEEANIISYTVIINANNPDKILYPGMTASVSIITGKREGVLRVPNNVLRYKPEGVEDAPGRGRRGGSGRIEQLAEQLDLTDDQQKQLREKMRAVFSGGGSGGGNPAERGANPRAAFEKALKTVLSDAQWQKYEAMREDNATTRAGTLWIIGDGEQPEAVRVRFGLADAGYTEVISDTLVAGSQIIQREAKAP